MLVLMPCNFMISRYQKRKQVRMMKFKDKRMKLMNEILNGMKVSAVAIGRPMGHRPCLTGVVLQVLKLYAWEEPFEKKVMEVRNTELSTLRRGSYFDALNAFILNCTPFMVSDPSGQHSQGSRDL